ncbi:hypothetical protein BJ742DRAFT_854408 [Cladochytrium replicatum]|nr:hypothetical protein BJ742DRAFT_854408 [Cladochytrium replicatum]
MMLPQTILAFVAVAATAAAHPLSLTVEYSPLRGLYCSAGKDPFCCAVWAAPTATRVSFHLEGPSSAGWIAVGLGMSMVNADIMASWRNLESGNMILFDYFSTDAAQPMVDNMQDLTLIGGGDVDGKKRTSVLFTRPRVTNDTASDIQIPTGPNAVVNLIWALGVAVPTAGDSQLPKHSSAGVFALTLAPSDPATGSSTLLDIWMARMGGESMESTSSMNMRPSVLPPFLAVLFSGVPADPSRIPLYVISVVSLLLVGCIVEALATVRPILEHAVTPKGNSTTPRTTAAQWTLPTYLVGGTVRFVEIALTYTMMLVVMSFDPVVFVAVIASWTIGYIVFTPIRMRRKKASGAGGGGGAGDDVGERMQRGRGGKKWEKLGSSASGGLDHGDGVEEEEEEEEVETLVRKSEQTLHQC